MRGCKEHKPTLADLDKACGLDRPRYDEQRRIVEAILSAWAMAPALSLGEFVDALGAGNATLMRDDRVVELCAAVSQTFGKKWRDDSANGGGNG